MTEASVFTKIINGELPASKVYEDDQVIAILALHPVRPGHTLVIPKEEINHMHHVPEETLMHMMKVARQISMSLEKTYQPQRVSMAVIGFEVHHAHLHLIPAEDAFDVTFKPMLDGTLGQMTGDELEAEAEKIRGNM